jgi:tripartite-type tricarboxylate transporter receptor subunit TctC
MPASLMSLLHFTRSLRITVANSSGVLLTGSARLCYATPGEISAFEFFRRVDVRRAGRVRAIVSGETRARGRAFASRWRRGYRGARDRAQDRIGIVGAEIVAKSVADGYTLMFTTSALAVREAVYSKLPFNILRDFQPVSQSVTQSNVLVTHPSVAAKNVQELIALAKAKPGQLNYGSGGNASSSHLACELFRMLAGIDVVHVPYKGVPAALGDTIAGRMHFTIGSPVSTLHHVKDGRLKLIAVTTPKRSPALPDVPTIAEAGVPGYEFTGWMGWLAPAATPRAIITKLHVEAARIVHLPDVKQRFVIDAADPVGSTPPQFAAHLKSEIERWRNVVKQANIVAE